MLRVKWCGIDFGQCLMDPRNLRNKWLWGDICKKEWKPQLIDERIRRYRILKEKYGSYGAIREKGIPEVLSFVLENSNEALKLYQELTQNYLTPAEGAIDTLKYLKDEGIKLYVVAELRKTLGPIGTDIVSSFLLKHGLIQYFDAMVTPQGKIDFRTHEIDYTYCGKTKEDGKLYDKLAEDLRQQGIQPSECVMVGDKPETDIIPAKKRGFHTIQFIGYYDFGPSGADYTISTFPELKNIIKGIKSDEK